MTKKRDTKHFRVTIHPNGDFQVNSKYLTEPFMYGNQTFLIKGQDNLTKFIRSLEVIPFKNKRYYAEVFKDRSLNQALLNAEFGYFFSEPFDYTLSWEPVTLLKIE